jgi:ribosomal protein S18 acetylase RimI-like enzyme
MNPFTLRRARPDDHPAIARILSQGHDEHAAALPWLFRATSAPFPASYLAELLADPRALVLVAVVDAGEPDAKASGGTTTVGGYAIALLRDAPDIPPLLPRRFLYLEDLGVDRHLQRRGLGRSLVEGCVAWGRDLGATALELNVFDFNQGAIRFYERLGLRSLHQQMHRAL